MAKKKDTSFWQELKRRNVIRATIAYTITGWLIMQIAAIVLPAFEAPGLVIKVLILLLVLGFPVAIVGSWFFEMTSEGLKRSNAVNQQESKAAGKSIRNIIYTVLSLAILYLLYDKFFMADSAAQANQGVPDFTIDKSIAVLPFADMSPKKDQEYLGDGIAEEILNSLAKVKDLKVIGRTSSFAYKGKNTDLRTIGKELGVATILEGSIRKDGNQVRITAQFINVTDGSHIWSKSYDRELKEIFKIQDELAQNISESLLSTFEIDGPNNPGAEGNMDDEANNLYLLGKYLQSKPTESTEEIIDNTFQAISLFEQSIELDDSFAKAYAGLAVAYGWIGFFQGENVENVWDISEKYAIQALDLDDTNFEALNAIAYVKRNRDWDWEGAQEYYQRSLLAAPNSSRTLRQYAMFLSAINQLDSAVFYASKAVDLNPTSDDYRSALMRTMYYNRKYSMAFDQSEMLKQSTEESRAYIRRILFHTDRNKAIPMLLDNSSLIDEASKIELKEIYQNQGWDALQKTLNNSYKNQNWAILFYIYGDQKDKVFQILAERVENKAGSAVYLLADPMFDPLRSDPRFDELLKTMGLYQYK